MEWENPGSAPNPIPRASPNTYQPLRSGYTGQDSRRASLEHVRDRSYPQDYHLYARSHAWLTRRSCDSQDAIYREIEKELIRDEIIMFEIMRRRTLEAEVRRELMVEQELALRTGHERFPIGSTSSMRFNSPVRPQLLGPGDEDQLMQKRVVPTLLESSKHETGEYDALMAPQLTGNLRVSEVDPVAEIGEEKEEIILLAKPDESISGLKRKGMTPMLKVEAGESPSDDPLKKKLKTEWTCDICHITTTSENGLNDHLKGKKHKAKEYALKSQVSRKDYCIGFYTKEDSNTVQIADPPNKKKSASVSLQIQKASSEEDSKQELQENENLRTLKGSKKVVDEKGQNSKVQKELKFKFWCEMCQVGAFTKENMNVHKRGKKHARLAQTSSTHEMKTEVEDHASVDEIQCEVVS